jgi:hypothetical protein
MTFESLLPLVTVATAMSATINDGILTFLQGLTPKGSTDYSLWKVTKTIKQNTKSSPPLRATQGTRARNLTEKAHTTANHLTQVFQLHLTEHAPDET